MAKDTVNRLEVELHVPDFAPVFDFYGKLGFQKVAHRSDETNPNYLVMERDHVVLCFWPGNDSYYEAVKPFANVVEELRKRPWGLKDFRVEDPFGYYLRITERHDITDPNYAVAKETDVPN